MEFGKSIKINKELERRMEVLIFIDLKLILSILIFEKVVSSSIKGCFTSKEVEPFFIKRTWQVSPMRRYF
jgi:hypothetical protein